MTKYRYKGVEFGVQPDSFKNPRFYSVSGLSKKGKEHLLKDTDGYIDGWTQGDAVRNAKRFIDNERTRY